MGWLKRNETQVPPWYADGLRFGCQKCGRCCGGAPGYVWLDQEDIAIIGRHMGLEAETFRKVHVRKLWRGLCLKEKPNWDCAMLDDAGQCRVYPVRPTQCRTWPFWPSNLRSRKVWEGAAKRCAGIGKGPLYRLEQIEALRMEMTI